ncbi:carnitine 3-dehydrogenase [Profundibacter amoris]|uniref:L-carnitine dehydrogenase n=1 Tax=Profundibacter amoris TaxID=2171755 RepID=A0A347UD51_9RHOB|nr:carnitine 3-dehydrogenase [Profundibacter amoris]AXX96779.1 carnitine 3-dehydrogenase [Profundibacter amoris]
MSADRKTAAIIGGGVIGGGWAARFLLNGWDVCVFDPDAQAQRKITAVLENARYALPMLYNTALPDEGSLTYCETISGAVQNADWIQESAPERLALKRKVYQTTQEHCRADAIIASSTSGFKPSEIQGCATRPEQIIVAHPFNPVYLLPLVEIVATDENPPEMTDRATGIIESLGMFPLRVRAEIDAHIADRFLEAVWREALWLIKGEIATTEEIDNAIRYGFGLRWAQMGLFETYRIAGGEAGMRHFIDQFGPCLQWPWTKLMDVPELTDELVEMIASQSDAQSGAHTIRQLERMRDENLVGILLSLKTRDAAAGALLNTHEARITQPPDTSGAEPITTLNRNVPIDWTDYNGHMNESRYGQVFSDAADVVMALLGADAEYIKGDNSYFTVDIHIRFLQETRTGQRFSVHSRVLLGEGKKLRLYHKMLADDGSVIATGEQMLIHVSLKTRRACEPQPEILAKLESLAAAHATIPLPDHLKDT